MEPDWFGKSILILGCGNVLFGDDGFGPAVAQHLQDNFTIPADICVLNTGTSVRKVLFDTMLSDSKPKKIVIVDAMDFQRRPGELFAIDIDSYPKIKLDDFSMHQVPTSNLLRELRDLCGVEVTVMACQVSNIPESVNPGLSKSVKAAVVRAAKMLALEYFR